ncbi:type I restriction-modification system subunit M N-terminal domain-containing protein [Riemerella anatipestifer]|uniref:type I restriction-modification system subunit M N-terminal domain-containing protein n=1 Tax=Riemerella anatipestifer TaxID=34085 RepID=UPI001C87EAFF|nr:type I restriction-modification system subunit M N-terminal domain-containing protein [Riemerella anatipestifer]
MITKQALGSTLFGMADILRDKVEDYKAYILSLLFFKRLSDNYEWETENEIKEFVKREGRQPTERELEIIMREKHDFKIPEGCFWKDVRDASPDKKNEKLNKAVNEIADANVDRNGKAVLIRSYQYRALERTCTRWLGKQKIESTSLDRFGELLGCRRFEQQKRFRRCVG